MGEEPYERRAKMNKSIKTLFPDQEGRTCAVCKEGLGDDKRRTRYCSDRCKDIAYAVQRLFLWRKVRNEFMEEAEEVCQRCGYNPEEHKEELAELSDEIEEEYDQVNSVYMERTRQMQADHIKPVAKGGDVFDKDNLQVLCDKCNGAKGDNWNPNDLEEWMSRDLEE